MKTDEPLYPTLSSRDDSSSQSPKAKEKRRAPAPLREQRIPSSKNRRFVSLRKTLPSAASKRDEPIVEGSKVYAMPSSGPVAVASVLELEFTVQKKLLFNGYYKDKDGY